MLSKQSAERRVAGVSPLLVKDEKWEKAYPTLWAHLTQVQWDDGSSRQTSSLLVFAGDSTLKAMLRDREAGLCLWVAADSMDKLWKALEGSLNDPQAEWRVDRQAEGQQASRVKRGKS